MAPTGCTIRQTLPHEVVARADLQASVLIDTDGFTPYDWVIFRVFGPTCVHGQVIKTRRKTGRFV